MSVSHALSAEQHITIAPSTPAPALPLLVLSNARMDTGPASTPPPVLAHASKNLCVGLTSSYAGLDYHTDSVK